MYTSIHRLKEHLKVEYRVTWSYSQCFIGKSCTPVNSNYVVCQYLHNILKIFKLPLAVLSLHLPYLLNISFVLFKIFFLFSDTCLPAQFFLFNEPIFTESNFNSSLSSCLSIIMFFFFPSSCYFEFSFLENLISSLSLIFFPLFLPSIFFI